MVWNHRQGPLESNPLQRLSGSPEIDEAEEWELNLILSCLGYHGVGDLIFSRVEIALGKATVGELLDRSLLKATMVEQALSRNVSLGEEMAHRA